MLARQAAGRLERGTKPQGSKAPAPPCSSTACGAQQPRQQAADGTGTSRVRDPFQQLAAQPFSSQADALPAAPVQGSGNSLKACRACSSHHHDHALISSCDPAAADFLLAALALHEQQQLAPDKAAQAPSQAPVA
jgi:hypothetical protein